MVSAKREFVRDALSRLASDEAEPYSARPGTNNSVLYRFDVSATRALAV